MHNRSDLQKGKGLQHRPVPVINLASHGLVNVPQGNAQQSQWLMWIQAEGMEELPQCLSLSRLQHSVSTIRQSMYIARYTLHGLAVVA